METERERERENGNTHTKSEDTVWVIVSFQRMQSGTRGRRRGRKEAQLQKSEQQTIITQKLDIAAREKLSLFDID